MADANSLWEQIKRLSPDDLAALKRRLSGEEPDEEEGGSGVREPRRPAPSSGGANAIAEEGDRLPSA